MMSRHGSKGCCAAETRIQASPSPRVEHLPLHNVRGWLTQEQPRIASGYTPMAKVELRQLALAQRSLLPVLIAAYAGGEVLHHAGELACCLFECLG